MNFDINGSLDANILDLRFSSYSIFIYKASSTNGGRSVQDNDENDGQLGGQAVCRESGTCASIVSRPCRTN